MAWTATVVLDRDKADVGLITASYSDAGDAEFPPENPYTLSTRAEAGPGQIAALVALAQSKLAAERTYRQSNATKSQQLTGLLNA